MQNRMRYNFCTLFDKNYLTRGLSLHQSLLQHAGDFHLWILCMDDTVYTTLGKLKLERVTLIRLTDFEDSALLKIKPTRTAVEYCWTLTPSLPLYVLKTNPRLDTIAYLDADTFFFSSPQPIYDEFIGHSVLIIKHNYAPQHQAKEATSGIYNVELLIFKNDQIGNEVLQWWRERCIEWCFFRFEDGKLGDQLYLNDWPKRFKGIHVLKHIGGGVAPWNINQYALTFKQHTVLVNDQPVIFYHYHAFRWYSHYQYEPSLGYHFDAPVIRHIYRPYLQTLRSSLKLVQSIQTGFHEGFHQLDRSWKARLQRTFKWLIHHQYAAYLFFSTVFLLALNTWIWPTSDEFLYGVLANAFTAAAGGDMLWSDINTEHTWLIALIIFIYNNTVQPDSIIGSRVVIFPFAIGIIILLHKIPQLIGLDKKYHMWWLWLLLLIPGFWLFSVRLMLDIPSAFSLILLLYLLLKRAPVYQVALSLMLVLMIKEYYVYLTLPIITVVYACDALFQQRKTRWKKVGWLVANVVAMYLPIFIMVTILIDFNWLPYPRILESNLQMIFGDLFTLANRTWLILLQNIIHPFQQASAQTITPEIITTSPNLDVTTVIDPVKTVVPDTSSTIVEAVTEQSPIDFTDKISALSFSGRIPTGAFESTAPIIKHGFWTRWWLVYKYNLSETDIYVLILPLVAIGIAIRANVIKRLYKHYDQIRTDLIFFLFLVIFFYFNYHQADEMHGFRITIPIIVSFIYFAFFAARALLERPTQKMRLWFGLLCLLSSVLYWFTTCSLQYGSLLGNLGTVEPLTTIKPYLYIVLFMALAGIVLCFKKIKHPLKYHGLVVIMMMLFALKFFPFYINDRLETNSYGNHYGIVQAQPILDASLTQAEHIYSNTHPYRLQYYANDPRFYNVGINPRIRIFQNAYPVLYHRFPLDQDFYTNLMENQIRYVFILNDDYDEAELHDFEKLRQIYPTAFIKLADSYHSSGRLQWVLYEFTQDFR